ncbi:unnamed protein product, partial [Brachionus calyciflorus]
KRTYKKNPNNARWKLTAQNEIRVLEDSDSSTSNEEELDNSSKDNASKSDESEERGQFSAVKYPIR